tara:strand:+ start:447 stop:647 length:201 start_codon:yes stop_codon:yes gene_type:complete
MRKVTVQIPEVHMSYMDLEVEDNATDAEILLMANGKMESGDYNDALEYSHTMDINKWDIEWHKKED